MAMSARKTVAIWQMKWNADSSIDESTMEQLSSKKAKVNAIALNPPPLNLEPEPIDATSTRNIWAAEATVDIMGRILYEVNSDQCDFGVF
jgi:hypothetical protein